MTTLFNKVYYALRPIIPWKARMSVRRWRAGRRRNAYADVWPIDERAGGRPPNWPGWPEAKQFALVLTHDVEGPRGLRRVGQLMELDAKYGFRSSFNFVPEGAYRVPDAQRSQLELAGFEVGVHGLKHDGKMFFSKKLFVERVVRIKQYLHRWDAAGFRSSLMHHNMAWQYLIGSEYDASTFDTDPFEPMPDGAGTIFPFWVPGKDGNGLVELPYTLAQDFTLFKVLQERNIDIWKRKLDWIAARGGMALLITHPDYIDFEGQGGCDEFPVSHYENFLRYVRDQYADAFWHVVPREVARFYRTALPPELRNTRKKVCVLTHGVYDQDHHLRQHAEMLASRGDLVEVISLSDAAHRLGEDEVAGVRVSRIQRHDGPGKIAYAWSLLRFLVASSILLTGRHRKVRYDLIHIHSTLGMLGFAAWYPKWTGVKLLLELHHIAPKCFTNRVETKLGALTIRALGAIQKASAKFADHVVFSDHRRGDKLASRPVEASERSAVLDHVDQEVLNLLEGASGAERFIIIFPDTSQCRQGMAVAVRALACLRRRIPNIELRLYGGGGGDEAKVKLVSLADELGVSDAIKFGDSVVPHQVQDMVADNRPGIAAPPAGFFWNGVCNAKIMETVSQGLPAVVWRTKSNGFSFNDRIAHFFLSGESEAAADAMVELIENQPHQGSLGQSRLERAGQNGWNTRECEYTSLVDSLSTESFEDFDDSTRQPLSMIP